MALFGRDKKKDAAVAQEPAAAPQQAQKGSPVDGSSVAHVLVRPHITEKATDQVMENTYVFDIATRANKPQVAAAVRAIYKVEPVSVRIVNNPAKKVRNARTGVWGTTNARKKAYVKLKEGDSISMI